MAMHDLIIRGPTVVDGLGGDPIRADVAVRDGRIAAIGEVGKDASEIVDAGAERIEIHALDNCQVTHDQVAQMRRRGHDPEAAIADDRRCDPERG